MIKREDIKKMYVWDWDDNEECERKRERYVLFKNEDGSCLAVNIADEYNFENKKHFDTTNWKHCKPIPEQKKRIMTRNEVLKFVLENHDKILVRHFNDTQSFGLGSSFSYTYDIETYRYIFIDELGKDEQPKKFEIEEV